MRHDCVRQQSLDLSGVQILVLDEADEMLDMGFAEDLEHLLDQPPAGRQTALFSATMPARIQSIAQKHLRNPARVTISGEKSVAGQSRRIRQVAYVVARAQKPAALQRILDTESPVSALVFCRTRLQVDTLVESLNAHGFRAEALHGGMQQRQRDAVMTRFRKGTSDLIIATVADLRAKRLELTRASLREQLLGGNLDDVRVVVESLAEEFDVVDVAAAAVKLAHAGMARLFIGAGRQAGIRPADIVGAITNETGVTSSELGAIEIRDRFSLVEVPMGLRIRW